MVKDCIVSGPLALDIAVSKDAARAKGADTESTPEPGAGCLGDTARAEPLGPREGGGEGFPEEAPDSQDTSGSWHTGAAPQTVAKLGD